MIHVRLLWGLYARSIDGGLVYERWLWGAFLRVRPMRAVLLERPAPPKGTGTIPPRVNVSGPRVLFVDPQVTTLDSAFAVLEEPLNAASDALDNASTALDAVFAENDGDEE